MVSNNHSFDRENADPAAKTRGGGGGFFLCHEDRGGSECRDIFSRMNHTLVYSFCVSSASFPIKKTTRVELKRRKYISHASCIAGGTRTRPLLGNRTPCRASVAPCRPVGRCRSVSSAYVYYFIQYKIVFDHTWLEKIIHHVHTSQYTYVVFITFRSGIGHMRHDAPMVGDRGRERDREWEASRDRHAVGSLV